jgi:hypothetical protein
MLIEMPEYSDQESPCCAAGLHRPPDSALYGPWFCRNCGTPYDSHTGRVARKACLGCDTTLAYSDPDICTKCDEHGVTIVNDRAYTPV